MTGSIPRYSEDLGNISSSPVLVMYLFGTADQWSNSNKRDDIAQNVLPLLEATRGRMSFQRPRVFSRVRTQTGSVRGAQLFFSAPHWSPRADSVKEG